MTLTKVHNRMIEGAVANVKDFGAVGDGVTDDTADFKEAAATNSYAIVPEGTYMLREDGFNVPSGFFAYDPNAILENNENDERVLLFVDNGSQRTQNVLVDGLTLVDGGIDSTNNSAAVFSSAVDHSHYIRNKVPQCTVGISSQYGSASLGPYSGNPATEDQPERQSRDNVYAFNDVQASNMAFEFFSALRHRGIGNNAYNDGVAATSHAYRITGFPGMPCDGNAYVGNTATNYVNGVSFQTSAHYNVFSGFAFTDMVNGVQLNPNLAYANDHTGFNYIQGTVARATRGLYADNPSYTKFDLIVDDISDQGLWLDKTANFGSAAHCIVDAIVRDGPTALLLETDRNIVRLTASQLTSNAISISGSNNIVDIVVDDIQNVSGSFSLVVSGNKNQIRCIASSNTTPATADISVTGDDNIVHVDAAIGVSCTGERNTIEGNLGAVVSLAGSVDTILRGTATSVVRGGTNTDYTGLRKGSGRGQISTTTDGSGEVTLTVTGIPTGLTAYGLLPQYVGFLNNRYIVVKTASVASNTLTAVLRFMKDDGTAAASEAVFCYYEYFAY